MNEYEQAVSDFVKSKEQVFNQFVVPLLTPSPRSRKSTPEFVGTGFFVQYNDSAYLVSANHVISDFSTRQAAIYSFGPSSRGLFEVSKHANKYCSHGDIAILKVASVEAEGLAPYSLEPKIISEATDNILHVWGYPGSKNKRICARKESQPVGMTVKIVEQSIDRTGMSSLRNAALDRGDFVESVMSPYPKGMSGSPIFSIGPERLYTKMLAGASEFELMGVFTEYDKQNNTCQYELLAPAIYACRTCFTDFHDWTDFQKFTIY